MPRAATPRPSWLDKSTVISLHKAREAADSEALSPPPFLKLKSLPIARRRVMQAGAAIVMAPAAAYADAGLVVRRTAQGFHVSWDGQVIWEVDSRWLVSSSLIAIESSPQRGRIKIAGASYPGSDLPANLDFELTVQHGRPLVVLSLGGIRTAAAVDLQHWVAGLASIVINDLPTLLRLPHLKVSASGARAALTVNPDLSVKIEGSLDISGRRLAGRAQTCSFVPVSSERLLQATARESRARAMTVVLTGSDGFQVKPAVRQQRNRLDVEPFRTSRVRLELMETPEGLRHALSAQPIEDLVLQDRVGGDGSATVHAVGASYVESGAGEQMVVATRVSATVRAAGAVLRGESRPGDSTVVCTRDSGYDVDCSFRWESGAFMHEHGIKVVMKALPGSDTAQLTGAQIRTFLNAAPWQPRSLDLDGMELEFFRPEDSLWLRFRFLGYELRRGAKKFTIARTPATKSQVWVVFPPQAISEEAFFRAPKIEPPAKPDNNPRDQFKVPVASTQNEIRKSHQSAAPNAGDRERDANDRPTGGEPVTWPVRARVAGESQLCLTLRPDASGTFNLELANLLDPKRWQFVVADAAYSSLATWRAVTGRKDFPPPVRQADLPAITRIEMPWRLHISPDECSELLHARIVQKRPSGKEFRRAFYVSARSGEAAALPLRAIYTRDYLPGSSLPLHFGSSKAAADARIEKRRHELDENDRAQIRLLSSEWGTRGLLGSAQVHLTEDVKDCQDRYGYFEPKPFDAELFRLTARGGSMRSHGSWDPPYLRTRPGATCDQGSGFALSLEKWDHTIGDSRTHHTRTVYLGYILPYGHRAALIRITPREIEDQGARGPLAVNVQRYYIRIVTPSMGFPRVEQPPESLNSFCHPEIFSIESPGDLQIDNPKDKQLAGLGPSAFIICRGGQPHIFKMRLASGGTGDGPLAFVDNTVTHDAKALDEVVKDFNSRLEELRCTLPGTDITYAPAVEPGETTWPTHELKVSAVVNWKFLNSVLLESRREPPFYPVVDAAKITVRSIDVQTGAKEAGPVWVNYDPLYKTSAFESAANPAQLYLDLVEPRNVGFRGRSDRSAGVANTDSICRALARGPGPVGFTGAASAVPGADTARAFAARSTKTEVRSDFAFDKSAKILGNIPIVALLEALGLDELPKLIEQVEQRLDAAGRDLLDALPAFFEDAHRAVAAASEKWGEACIGSQSEWCQSSTYVEVDKKLKQVSTSLKAAASQQAAGDAPALLGAIGEVGSSVQDLARALKKVADSPDLLLADLLRASVFNDLFEWVKDLQDAVQGQVGAIVARVMDEAVEGVLALLSQADNHVVYSQQLLEDLEARPYALVSQVREQANRLRIDFEREARQWETAAADQLLSMLLQTVGPLAGGVVDLYTMYQGLVDDLRASAQKYATEAQAWMDAAKNARQRLETEFQAAATDLIFGMLGLLENWLQKNVYDPAIAGSADVVRQLEPELRAIRDISLAVREAKGTRARVEQIAAQRAGRPPNPVVLRPLVVANMALMYLQAAQRIVVTLRTLPTSPGTAHWKAAADSLQVALDQFGRELLAGASQSLGARVDAIMAAAKSLQSKLAGDKDFHSLTRLLNELAPSAWPPTAAAGADALRLRLTVAVRMSGLPQCVLKAGSLGAIDPAACLNEWPLYNKAMIEVQKVIGPVWRAAKPLIALAHQVGASSVVSKLEKNETALSVFGPHFFEQLKLASAALGTVAAFGDTPSLKDLATIAQVFNEKLVKDLRAVIDKLDASKLLRNLEAAAIAEAERQIRLLAAKFVPAKISTSYTFSKDIKREYCGIFLPGVGKGATCVDVDASLDAAKLTLTTAMQADLLEGTSSFMLDGEIKHFQINIFGFMRLPIESIHFKADPDSGFRMDPPVFCLPDLNSGPLAFLQQLMDLLGGRSGFFLMPLPRGVRAGFRFGTDVVQAGGMTIQNFSIEAALLLPFDDRAAEVSFAVASREAPMLISVGIWGGGGFFEMVVAMDRLVSISASFEYGLVGAFNLPAVQGQGRVTIGLYYRQAGSVSILEGFFYAGGSATVLSIVSICADLTVRLIYKNKEASGEGRFGVRIGAGPFSWTLHYSVEHSQGGGASKLAALGAGKSIAGPGVQRIKSTLDDSAGLLAAHTWDAYRMAFETDEEHS